MGVLCLVLSYFFWYTGNQYDTGVSDFFAASGIIFIMLGTVPTFMFWGLTGSSFNETMFSEDTRKLGFEQVKVIQNEHEFVGSLDGEFVTCAILETGEEYKYRLLCDN